MMIKTTNTNANLQHRRNFTRSWVLQFLTYVIMSENARPVIKSWFPAWHICMTVKVDDYLRELKIPPPKIVFKTTGMPFKANCAVLQCRRFLNQQCQTVTPLQHFLNIINHHASHLSLCMCMITTTCMANKMNEFSLDDL